MNPAIDGGAASCFHSATDGRRRKVLTDDQITRPDQAIAELPPDAAESLLHGSLAPGWRA